MCKRTSRSLVILLIAVTEQSGCSGTDAEPAIALTQEQGSDNGLSLNGLSRNGLSWNGLSWNGLSWNGLSWNGLSWNGLSSAEFSRWFSGNAGGPQLSDQIMRYIVRCAIPAGASRSATIDGVLYTWPGQLGLAPQWAAGSPIPPVEQQLVSACLAAHVNKYGQHVSISLSGYLSSGAAIPTPSSELKAFPVKEGCFFGNLFSGEGLFVGNDSVWAADKSSSRDCAITVAKKVNDNCPPMVFAGECGKICVPDGPRNAYFSCTYSGISYSSLNTRITHEEIYQCGDHVCQISEHCGTGKTPDDCKDCGPCP